MACSQTSSNGLISFLIEKELFLMYLIVAESTFTYYLYFLFFVFFNLNNSKVPHKRRKYIQKNKFSLVKKQRWFQVPFKLNVSVDPIQFENVVFEATCQIWYNFSLSAYNSNLDFSLLHESSIKFGFSYEGDKRRVPRDFRCLEAKLKTRLNKTVWKILLQ